MFRFVSEFISLIFVFLLFRSVIGTVWKLLGSGVSSRNPAYRGQAQAAPKAEEIRTSGQLRKDPVCGTFVSTTSPYTASLEGVTFYFCSKQCRDVFKSGRNTQDEWQKSTVGRS